jgi:hypothetical protein
MGIALLGFLGHKFSYGIGHIFHFISSGRKEGG